MKSARRERICRKAVKAAWWPSVRPWGWNGCNGVPAAFLVAVLNTAEKDRFPGEKSA